MPEIIIHALDNLSIDQKRAICSEVTDVVVKHSGAPKDGVIVMIVPHALDSKSKGGVLFSDRQIASAPPRSG